MGVGSKREDASGSHTSPLELNSIRYCQSMALARYAAKLAGYYPMDDPLEALVVDEAMDACSEIQTKVPTKDDDEQDCERRCQEWQAGQLTQYANLIERRIQASGGTSVVKTASVADLIVWTVVNNAKSGIFSFIDKDFFDSFPGILATSEAIIKDPKVKSYYQACNKTVPAFD